MHRLGKCGGEREHSRKFMRQMIFELKWKDAMESMRRASWVWEWLWGDFQVMVMQKTKVWGYEKTSTGAPGWHSG